MLTDSGRSEHFQIGQRLKKRLPDLMGGNFQTGSFQFRHTHKVSISPITYYTQLLCAKIPKAKKRQSTQAAFCVLGSSVVKAECKLDDKIDPRCQFHQDFTSSFFVHKCFSQLLCAYIICFFFISWRKEIGAKAACKLLVKLTTGITHKCCHLLSSGSLQHTIYANIYFIALHFDSNYDTWYKKQD